MFSMLIKLRNKLACLSLGLFKVIYKYSHRLSHTHWSRANALAYFIASNEQKSFIILAAGILLAPEPRRCPHDRHLHGDVQSRNSLHCGQRCSQGNPGRLIHNYLIMKSSLMRREERGERREERGERREERGNPFFRKAFLSEAPSSCSKRRSKILVQPKKATKTL
jgi:hypothetical protein